MNYQKYHKGYFPVPDFKRTWPEKEIEKAPIWCSVDLRDGNQALITPMNLDEKLEFFQFLVDIGFKEIEIGFPAASETEYQFTRTLIEEGLIPDDVTIQVLTQSREHIINKTLEAIRGAKNAIVHLYNSTSRLQRQVVFKKDKPEIVKIATDGATLIKEKCAGITDCNIRFEYSPESFTGTEMEFAAEICNAVLDIWKPTPDRKAIINLPSTIEVSTPNVYADQIEYMCGALHYRDAVEVSVHAHNDRGCAVAASELAVLAGADRVEGTLFGNGERTGNADIMVIALNLFSQGIDPKLELDRMEEMTDVFERSTKMSIHPRHPYAGSLVYTAFSGSHQDAIRKGMDAYEKEHPDEWDNPYLPIDPTDLGRVYEPVRINSQSGKGGVGFIMDKKFGLILPKGMAQDFSYIVTDLSDKRGAELSPEDVYNAFIEEYVNDYTVLQMSNYSISMEGETTCLSAEVTLNGKALSIEGTGNGPLAAMMEALKNAGIASVEIADYSEHALETGSASRAATYIAVRNEAGKVYWGCGIHTSINTSSMMAIVSAVNRALSDR